VSAAALATNARAATLSFEDATRSAGLDHKRSGTWGSLFVDRDGDGLPDLFVGRHGVNPFFFRNRGGGTFGRPYYDFVEPRGYRSLDGDDWVDRHSCAWGEATGEGPLELYCTVGANVGTSVGPNQLLSWTSGGMRDIAKAYGVRDAFGRGRSVNWLDYDTDGDLDLFVGNWERADHPSALFENRRGRFARVRAGVEHRLRTLSSSWSDWDRDGDPDLLVMQYGAGAVAYENRRRGFEPVSLPGVTGVAWYSAAWGDYDGDGYTDLNVVGETRSVIFHNVKGSFRAVRSIELREGRASAWLDFENDGDLDAFIVQGAPGTQPDDDSPNYPDLALVRRRGTFDRIQRPWSRGRNVGSGDSVATADYDRDGLTDAFVTNGFFEYLQWRGRSNLYRNTSESRNWIRVVLDGGRWNPLGVGAKIEVTTPSKTYRREMTDGVVFRNQSEIGRMIFGIGSAATATVRVEWPQGGADCMPATAGMDVEIERGTSPC
jgi:FG-GAP-like repeat/ASPIC and UnbV